MAKDILGTEIKIGDTVVVSNKINYSSELRLGIVTKTNDNSFSYTLLKGTGRAGKCLRPDVSTLVIQQAEIKNEPNLLYCHDSDLLNHKHVAITGAFKTYTRNDLVDMLNNRCPGIRIDDSVSDLTDYLLIPEYKFDRDSTKWKDALIYGIKILTEDDVLDILRIRSKDITF